MLSPLTTYHNTRRHLALHLLTLTSSNLSGAVGMDEAFPVAAQVDVLRATVGEVVTIALAGYQTVNTVMSSPEFMANMWITDTM